MIVTRLSHLQHMKYKCYLGLWVDFLSLPTSGRKGIEEIEGRETTERRRDREGDVGVMLELREDINPDKRYKVYCNSYH